MSPAPATDLPDVVAHATLRRAGAFEIEIRLLDRGYARLRVSPPAGQRARLVTSISLHGQRHPVLVVARDGGRYALIDGHRRVAALERIGRDTVTAIVLDLEESDALAHCHRMEAAGRRSALEEGWLVAEMIDQARSPVDIGAALDRSPSWVSRRLALARALPERAMDAVRAGVIPAHGAMKSLVPLARANKNHCEILCERLGATRVSTRQLGALYAAWRAGDAEQRERISSSPRLFLEAARAVTPARPEGVAGALVRDLETAHGALVRATDGAVRAWSLEPPALASPPVARALGRCTDAYEALVRHMEEPDAG